MKATVGNLIDVVKNTLVEMGYSLTDQLSIDFIDEVADKVGVPPAKVEGIDYSGRKSRPQHKEDGSFFEI